MSGKTEGGAAWGRGLDREGVMRVKVESASAAIWMRGSMVSEVGMFGWYNTVVDW